MADSYEPYSYGNPTLFFDSNLNPINETSNIGSGHRLVVEDLDDDGNDEVFVGYELLTSDGKHVWTADCWVNRKINAYDQHVDHAESFKFEGKWYIAVAGSDFLYLINKNGKVVWKRKTSHPQYCIVGKLIPPFDLPGIVLFNSRGEVNLFDIKGKEIWRKKFPEHWPMGKPRAINKPFHMGEPAQLLRADGGTAEDKILYYEAGWPYLVDGNGTPCLIFEAPENSRKPEYKLPNWHRLDDYGMGYKSKSIQSAKGNNNIIIFDRRYAWLYQCAAK